MNARKSGVNGSSHSSPRQRRSVLPKRKSVRPRDVLTSGVFRPRTEIPVHVSTIISISGVLAFLLVWFALTAFKVVPEFFLPSPGSVIVRLWDMISKEEFILDILASVGRILGGFALASLIAVPLGILMGNFKPVQAFFDPLVGAFRYMPASAFLPLLVIWFGIEEGQKWAVVFVGVFFPLTLMIADAAASVSKDLINATYTLGATTRQVILRVLIPACAPSVLDNLRIAMGLAWTYLVVAELVGASRGIGSVILRGQRFLQTDQVIGGIIVIGILGILTDLAFRIAHRRLFPYLY